MSSSNKNHFQYLFNSCYSSFFSLVCLFVSLFCYFFFGHVKIVAKNSIEIYLNTGGHTRSRCQFTTYNHQNALCCQYRNGCRHSISDPHIVSSKKLSVGLRR